MVHIEGVECIINHSLVLLRQCAVFHITKFEFFHQHRA